MLSSTPNGACRPNIQHGFCAAVLAQGLAPNVNIDVGEKGVVRLMQGKMNPVPPSTPGKGVLSDWCREKWPRCRHRHRGQFI